MPTIITCDPDAGSASPDPVQVHGKDAELRFKLSDPSKWKWNAAGAISIQNGSAQFSGQSKLSDAEIKVTDANTDRVKYKYSFTATPKGGGSAVTIDPDIQNNND